MSDTGKQSTGVRRMQTRTGIPSARQMRNIGREIRCLSMSQDVTKTPTGYRYPTNNKARGPYAFQCTLSGGKTVTVRAGRYINHGSMNLEVTGDTATLAGLSNEYVFVKYDRASHTATIDHATSWPTSNSSDVFVVLCTYARKAENVYSLTEINHEGDINFDLPMG